MSYGSQEVSPRPQLHFFASAIVIERDDSYGPLHEVDPATGQWLSASLYQAKATVSAYRAPHLEVWLTNEETDQIMQIVDTAARREVAEMTRYLTPGAG
jgi:streptogramin lyase